MATRSEVLFSFVGDRDPYIPDSERQGPVLSLLEARSFDAVYLLCTGSGYLERARTVEKIAAERGDPATFHFLNIELSSPIDYEEIYAALDRSVSGIGESIAHQAPRYSVLLDPGTPQMQTAWFLLVRSGALPATLLQGVPPQFAGGVYKVKEVRLDSDVLPQITPPASLTRSSGRSSGDGETNRAAARGTIAQASGPEEAGAPATGLVGASPGFLELTERATRVAGYEVSVLIEGETGSGKGLLAKLIHEHSERRGNHFVAVNCSAVTSTLAESELFGHVKGAFTGASSERLGKFRAAHGGTVFLDEIGDLPTELQPKLLQALEEKTVTPVGADRAEHVDVRVVTATHKDLSAMIAEGTFRRDLYERLRQVTLRVPPLRERAEDIPRLAETFLAEWNRTYHEERRLTEEAVELLTRYPWPGNVRQLSNVIQAMCATAAGNELTPEVVPPEVRGYGEGAEAGAGGSAVEIPEEGLNVRAYLHHIEKSLYLQALERSGGNRERAAGLLGVTGAAFRKALRERFGVEG
jgi:DNA-binding NtrC family response regulator